jgi:hypothetical protein
MPLAFRCVWEPEPVESRDGGDQGSGDQQDRAEPAALDRLGEQGGGDDGDADQQQRPPQRVLDPRSGGAVQVDPGRRADGCRGQEQLELRHILAGERGQADCGDRRVEGPQPMMRRRLAADPAQVGVGDRGDDDAGDREPEGGGGARQARRGPQHVDAEQADDRHDHRDRRERHQVNPSRAPRDAVDEHRHAGQEQHTGRDVPPAQHRGEHHGPEREQREDHGARERAADAQEALGAGATAGLDRGPHARLDRGRQAVKGAGAGELGLHGARSGTVGDGSCGRNRA